jgi:hypothetical protein
MNAPENLNFQAFGRYPQAGATPRRPERQSILRLS